MTIKNVTLPMRVTQFENDPLVAVCMLAMGVCILFGTGASSGHDFQILIGILIVIVCSYVLLKVKPAHIEIDKTKITITPTPIMGLFRRGVPQDLSPSDFSGLALSYRVRRGGTQIASCILRSKTGQSDVTFDIPTDADARDFAEQLSAALNLRLDDKNAQRLRKT